MAAVFFILSLLCLIHYVIIVAYASLRAAFANFWLISSLSFFALCIIWRMMAKYDIFIRIPRTVKVLTVTVAVIGCALFIMLVSLVFSGMNERPKENADYLVVLGAKVEGRRITKSLRKRLDSAAEYLKENKAAMVVVSGGRGKGEEISEARAMKDYLILSGIDESRIIEEDKSTSTKENLMFSFELIKERGGSGSGIAVVTNNFHIYRAKKLARMIGMENPEGLAAPSDPVLLVNYIFRETAALIKEFITGNI